MRKKLEKEKTENVFEMKRMSLQNNPEKNNALQRIFDFAIDYQISCEVND